MIHWKTVLASAQQSGVCIYLSRRWETIKTKMIAHFEMQHRDIMRLQLLQEQTRQNVFFFLFHKWLLVLFTRTKKGPSFSINEAGNWVRGPAGYGLTTMAWGPNLTLSLCCGTAWKNFSLKPPPATSYFQLIHPFLILRWVASVQTAISGRGR